MSEPTPGPWVTNEYPGTSGVVVESEKEHGVVNDGWIIADCFGPDAEANARLIAAAPALYEALWQLLDDMGDDGLCVCPAAKEQAQNALRAASPDARGEEAAKDASE